MTTLPTSITAGMRMRFDLRFYPGVHLDENGRAKENDTGRTTKAQTMVVRDVSDPKAPELLVLTACGSTALVGPSGGKDPGAVKTTMREYARKYGAVRHEGDLVSVRDMLGTPLDPQAHFAAEVEDIRRRAEACGVDVDTMIKRRPAKPGKTKGVPAEAK